MWIQCLVIIKYWIMRYTLKINKELHINISLDSAKSPWPSLIFAISFHHRKFHEYEKIERKFLVHDIIFRFLSVHHNHIRNSEH